MKNILILIAVATLVCSCSEKHEEKIVIRGVNNTNTIVLTVTNPGVYYWFAKPHQPEVKSPEFKTDFNLPENDPRHWLCNMHIYKVEDSYFVQSFATFHSVNGTLEDARQSRTNWANQMAQKVPTMLQNLPPPGPEVN